MAPNAQINFLLKQLEEMNEHNNHFFQEKKREILHLQNEQEISHRQKDLKTKELLALQLQNRIKRLQLLRHANEDELLLFKISEETPKEKLFAFKENLQHRINTSVDKNEKTFLQEIVHALDSLVIKENYIPCHIKEMHYLMQRDLTILKETNLQLSLLHHKNQPFDVKRLFNKIVSLCNHFLRNHFKAPQHKSTLETVIIAKPIVTLVEEKPNIHEQPVPDNQIKDKEIDLIAEHNHHIIHSLENHITEPTGKEQKGLCSTLSMEVQKQIILKEILEFAHQKNKNHEIVNLNQITDALFAKYKSTPFENLLNFMVHHDNNIQLASLLAQNQNFTQSLLIKQTNVHSQHLNTKQ
ncbi:MAG: hypothetical protein JSR17_06535 [Proteobacteria bacterium]|nr:hypothetical protein [Pseudomonadota bacterium]